MSTQTTNPLTLATQQLDAAITAHKAELDKEFGDAVDKSAAVSTSFRDMVAAAMHFAIEARQIAGLELVDGKLNEVMAAASRVASFFVHEKGTLVNDQIGTMGAVAELGDLLGTAEATIAVLASRAEDAEASTTASKSDVELLADEYALSQGAHPAGTLIYATKAAANAAVTDGEIPNRTAVRVEEDESKDDGPNIYRYTEKVTVELGTGNEVTTKTLTHRHRAYRPALEGDLGQYIIDGEVEAGLLALLTLAQDAATAAQADAEQVQSTFTAVTQIATTVDGQATQVTNDAAQVATDLEESRNIRDELSGKAAVPGAVRAVLGGQASLWNARTDVQNSTSGSGAIDGTTGVVSFSASVNNGVGTAARTFVGNKSATDPLRGGQRVAFYTRLTPDGATGQPPDSKDYTLALNIKFLYSDGGTLKTESRPALEVLPGVWVAEGLLIPDGVQSVIVEWQVSKAEVNLQFSDIRLVAARYVEASYSIDYIGGELVLRIENRIVARKALGVLTGEMPPIASTAPASDYARRVIHYLDGDPSKPVYTIDGTTIYQLATTVFTPDTVGGGDGGAGTIGGGNVTVGGDDVTVGGS